MILLLKKLLIGAVFLYFALLFILVVFQRSFIYFPTTSEPSFSQYGQLAKAYESISVVNEDGLRISGWYHRGKDRQKPLIIWFQGNGGSYADRIYSAQFYVERGYSILLAGYRGYGGNPGKITERGLYQDADAWVRMAASRLKFSPDQMVLYGESLGTGIAVEMATRYRFKALILQTPYKSLRAIAQRQYPFYPITFLMKDHFDSLSRIQRIKAPVFMFHGDQDEVIPLSHAQTLFDAAPQPKSFRVIRGARHSDTYNYGVDKIVHSFLQAVETQ